MTDPLTGPTFEVTRTIVLRVGGPIEPNSASQLRRILSDLIDDHGVTDLVIDLTRATGVDSEIADVLDWTRQRLTASDGQLELRLPLSPVKALINISTDVPSFVPLNDEDPPT